ncbi:MAG: hypothetical protein IPM50_15245 [Acidobacteriota bacterium]|nr:MAG: hypothetical protein IPM50_15245 [Acidobacteriota bacterium]
MGSGTGVAAHPVAQLTEQVIPTCSLTQHPHRSHPPRTHSFHTIYDDNGNITRTTDSKGEYIDGSYDNLNRLKVRDYSDAVTPDVSFFYDGKGLGAEPARSKGKTTKVASTVSETRYTFFDELGRLKNHQQITDGQTYSTEYEYNLSGGLVSEIYPSGRTVNYEINADGDLSHVWGENGSAITTYANAFNYNVNGAVEKLRLGNGKWETASYNSRGQITDRAG